MGMPAIGLGNYLMLPDMGYTWRVRETTARVPLSEQDVGWGPWSPGHSFRTATRSSSRITPVSPADADPIQATSLSLQWDNADRDVFYYEIQVSADSGFGEEGPLAPVWHNLVHGGVTNPVNSWRTPDMQSSTTYYWRVRPRVQGDGTPVAWSQTWSFTTQ